MSDPIVVMTPDQLRDLVKAACAEAVSEVAPSDADIMDMDACTKMLKVDPRTLRDYVKRDGLPATRLGREYRFFRHEVIAWMKARKG